MSDQIDEWDSDTEDLPVDDDEDADPWTVCYQRMGQTIADAIDAEILERLLESFDEPTAPSFPPPPHVVAASRYPHSCPRCGGPAYVGLSAVDCEAGCR